MGFLSSIGGLLGGAIGSVIPGVGTAIGAAAGSAFGGFVGDNAGSIGSSIFSAYNARSAADTAYQRSMGASNTSHQREVADLEAAGLNPILSANSGAPAVSAPVPVTSPVQDPMAAATSALALKQTAANIDLVQAQTRKTDAEGQLTARHVPVADAENQLLQRVMPSVTSNANKVMDWMDHPFDSVSNWLDSLGNSAKSIPSGSSSNPPPPPDDGGDDGLSPDTSSDNNTLDDMLSGSYN